MTTNGQVLEDTVLSAPVLPTAVPRRDYAGLRIVSARHTAEFRANVL